MAGSTSRQQQLIELRAEHEALQEAHAELKRRVALEAPHILNEDAPPPRTEYTDDVPETVTALAEQGYTEPEWVAALGIDERTWDEWKRTFSPLAAAVSRARAAVRAYLMRESREAMAKGRNNFPSQVFERLMKAHDPDGPSAGEEDDASALIRLDLTAGDPVAKDGASSASD